jgi:uncharacterized protein YqjF (DUF2071 family)
LVHWPVAPSQLEALVPRGLEIDTFEGRAWLGIFPFRLTGFRLRGLPPVPVFSTFPELNVRTYVTAGGKPGIYFLSLDAGRQWAVAAARRFFKLPYYRARMVMRGRASTDFFSERMEDASLPRTFHARYRPVGEPFEAAPGTLEYFFAERYCLYTADKGRVLRAEAHHLPWSLRLAEAELDENTMVPAPVELPAEEPLLHYSLRQDALVWPLRRADGAESDSAPRT